jgi:hypothetical protein
MAPAAAIEPPAEIAVRPPRGGPAGPQLWAVALILAGLYYLWTRVLGSRRVGGDAIGSRRAEMTAARERQQQHLRDAAKKKKRQQRTDVGADDDDDDEDAGERNNPPSVNDGTTSSARSINERMRSMRERQAETERHRLLEEKRKKQRMLYLKQKALEEEEEERRRKDAELGPGWRYREDPNAAAANSINGMDPQSGGGGYKPQARKRKGG